MTGWRRCSVMDRFKWRSWKETTVEITFSGYTLEVISMMRGVNIHYSQSPMQGQAIANLKVKVNIHGHQRTAMHALLIWSMHFIQAHRVWIHCHSQNALFKHLSSCFVRSKVISHQREFLVESGPEEPKAERGMWVSFSRAASFTHSVEFQKKGLWLRYSICLISAGEMCNSQSSELKYEKTSGVCFDPEIAQPLKRHFCGESGASQRTQSNMQSAHREDITGYALVPLSTDGLEMKWQGHLCPP